MIQQYLMNLTNNNQLQQELMQFPIQEIATVQVEMSDKIFYRAYKYYSMTNAVIKYYSICKVIISLSFIYFNINVQVYSTFIVWLFGLTAISFVQFIYHLHIGNIMQDVYTFIQSAKNSGRLRVFPHNSNLQNRIQQHVHETYDFYDEPNLTNHEQKLRIIVHQIESWIKRHFHLQWKKIFLVIGYQIIQIFGFVIYANFDTTTLQGKFLVTILFLGIYQYLEVYLLIVIAILIFPFFLMTRLYLKLYQYYKKSKLQRILSQKSYSKQMQLEEEACPICIVCYSQGDKIIILPCNKSHNFHAQCIKNWIKLCENQPTCPMCRNHIS